MSNTNETKRILPWDNTTIKYLACVHGTPLQLYDGEAMIMNANKFLNAFMSFLPRFKQFFAVKALPNPHILKMLTDLGMGLDCSSVSELKLAQLVGIPGDRIMFTSNYTSFEELKLALDMNVIINLDDISLITKLWSINESLPKKLFFRLNPGIGRTDSETKSNVLGGPDAKFGMDEESIIKSCQIAMKLGVTEIGIHVMTGSNVLNLDYWMELIDKIFILIGQIKKLDIEIKYLNLGGGIGINYQSGELLDIKNLAQKIGKKITESSQIHNVMIPQVYMENGRFITGPYGYLISRCNNVKQLYGKTFYGLDACMSNLMRPGMYNSYHYISILDKDDTDVMEANVVGTLCENNDWFAKNRLLPKANPNDIFIIWDTGAHSHSMGFQYNGKLRAPEVLWNGDSFKVIRRRETFNDYIATVIEPNNL